MKNIILVIIILTIPFASFGQNKKELRKQLNEANILIKELRNETNILKEKLKVSFDTPENYVKSIFKLLKNKNLTEASKLLFSIDDSDYFSDKLNEFLKDSAKEDSITTKEWVQIKIKNKSIKSFDKVYYDGLNMGINWQSAVFEKATYNIVLEDKLDTYFIEDIKVFFKSSYKDYYLRIKDVFIIDDKPYNWKLRNLVDVQVEKEKTEKTEKEAEERKKQKEIEYKNKSYTPWGLQVGKADWNYRENNKDTFTKFRVKITNNTKLHVNRVKFQLSIYTGSSNSSYKFFGKTYDIRSYTEWANGPNKYINLQPGDVLTIPIQELEGFHLGEDVSNQKNWRIETKVLDVYPKHNEN